MEPNIEHYIEQLERKMGKNLKTAFHLTRRVTKSTDTQHPALTTMLRLAVSALQASGGLMTQMLRHTLDSGENIPPPSLPHDEKKEEMPGVAKHPENL